MARKARVVRTEFPSGRRVLAISDIHGNLPFFRGVLKAARYTPEDILVLVGDLVEKGPDSLALLRAVMERLRAAGYAVGNVDCTVLAQAPKLAPHILQMRKNLAEILGCGLDAVSVKATTEEGLGFTGAKEGIAAHAVVLLRRDG